MRVLLVSGLRTWLSDVVKPSFEANLNRSQRFKIAGGCARRTKTLALILSLGWVMDIAEICPACSLCAAHISARRCCAQRAMRTC